MPRLIPVHYGKFCKFLEYVGLTFKRQKGSHLVYVRDDLPRPIIVPKKKALSRNIILTNLRSLGISKEKYLDIITKIR